jgi:hypothetical protein
VRLDWNYEKQLKSELKAAEEGVAVLDAGLTRHLGSGLFGVNAEGEHLLRQVPRPQAQPEWVNFMTRDEIEALGDAALLSEFDYQVDGRRYAVRLVQEALERVARTHYGPMMGP